MKCDEIRDNLSAFFDGELAEREARTVSAHLDKCEACSRELDAIKRVAKLVQSLPRVTAPAELRTEVVGRIAKEERPVETRGRLIHILWPVATAACITLALLFLYGDERDAYRAKEAPEKGVARREYEIAEAPREEGAMRPRSDTGETLAKKLPRLKGKAETDVAEKKISIDAAVPGKAPEEAEAVTDAVARVGVLAPAGVHNLIVLRAEQPAMAMIEVRQLATAMRRPVMEKRGKAVDEAARERLETLRAVPAMKRAAETESIQLEEGAYEGARRALRGDAAERPTAKVADTYGSVTVEIPSERYQEFMAALFKLGRIETKRGPSVPRAAAAEKGARPQAARAESPGKSAAGEAKDRELSFAPEQRIKTVQLTIEFLPAQQK